MKSFKIKRSFYLLILVAFKCGISTAQNCNDLTILANDFTTTYNISYAKAGASYTLPIYDNDGRISCEGVTCSLNDLCGDGTSSLYYKVFYPSLATTKRLPTIVLFHGGGFSACADPSMGVEFYCQEFAKRNFVAISVEYRKGRLKDSKNKFTSASQTLALYRAIQDARGALRTIVADEKNNAQPFHIDFNNLFVGGVSAGSFIALGTAFFDANMLDQTFPGISAQNILGPIDADNYRGNKSYTIKGVMDMWGGASIPINATAITFFQNTAKPFIAFHGAKDPVVNISSSDLYFSKLSTTGCNYSSSNNICVDYTYPSGTNDGNAYLITLGSQKLYDAWQSMQVPCELYVDCEMKHGLDSNTNFGTDISQRDVRVYMVQRAVTFFQAVMNGVTYNQYGLSEFVENENLRVGCKPENHGPNATCYIPSFFNSTIVNNIKTNNTKTFFNVYATNKIIHTNTDKSLPSVVYIYNLMGTLVRKAESASSSLTIDGSSLPSGVYDVKIIQDNKSATQKIVLQ